MLLTTESPIIVNRPDSKFQTLLFIPEGEGRKGEGGLRTRGYFKHSYKLVDNLWYICDTEGNPVKPAPEDIQESIKAYVSRLQDSSQEPINYLPLISVITVVLNGEKYLEETIQSVINQTYPNVEYIIIDGGSTDGTLDIIKKYEDKIDYWVSEKDKGIYDAMNKGIRAACGNWINFMNAGDMFFNINSLKTIISKLKDRRYLQCFSFCEYYYHSSHKYIRKIKPSLKKYDLPTCHNAIIFPTDKKIRYDLGYKICSDYQYYLDYKANGYQVNLNDEVLILYLRGGLSEKSSILTLLEKYFISLKYNNAKKLILHLHFFLLFLRLSTILIVKKILPPSLIHRRRLMKGFKLAHE